MIVEARALLDERPADRAEGVARRFGMSQRTFQRRLRELGTSFQQEVTAAHVRIAKRLMRETENPLKWIAVESGYASLQHFSSSFRAHVGVSPSRWRSNQGQLDQDWAAAFPGGPENVVNRFGNIVSGVGWCLHPSGETNNSNMVIAACSAGEVDNWTIEAATSLNPPASQFTGCYVFVNQLASKVLSVYQGNVSNGAHVIVYDFCQPNSNACGSPAGYHADQFWCPWND